MPDIAIQPTQDLRSRFIAGAAGTLPFATSASTTVTAQSPRSAALKQRFAEFVGGVLVAPVIQEMQKSPFKTKYSSGGHGEDVFGGQMALELSKKIGRASEHGFGKHLYEAAIRQINAKGSSATGIPDGTRSAR